MSFAARRRLNNFDLATRELVREMRTYWSRNDFDEKYAVKSIQLGYASNLENHSADGHHGKGAA